ncbi:hypothetical protein KVR01_004734 [Diaporthe batatas]|uniref:uncharacterized protein n=1 Tax=Diaporthe batatas TaxID=748121 RepID=UPI001D05616E|nr:uncharacterized protein KVR01_004734 [Diaporthe batatas]KAG8166182.1 hypothetical protein KVR01_004734 [Diaporthe batatas]
MAQRPPPQSYSMASFEVQQFFQKVCRAAKRLLADYNRLHDEVFHKEMKGLARSAFHKALGKAFEQSDTVPVQPDYLIVSAGCWLWLTACEHVGFDLDANDYPECPENIGLPDMFNRAVPPSPEHEALIRDHRAKMAAKANEARMRTMQVQMKNKQPAQAGGDETPLPVRQENIAHVRREAEPQGNVSTGGMGSSQIMPTRAEVLPACVPAEQAIQKIQEIADNMKAAMMAETTNQVVMQRSPNNAASDPVEKYSIKVDGQATKFMQYLWDYHGFSSRYLRDDGYTCTSRPFEVKVHLSRATMFFGHEFGDRKKVLDAMRVFSPVRIYAHWEDDFAVIGLTTQEGEKWTDPSDRINHFGFLRSLTIAMNQLAFWARDINRGEPKSFAGYIQDWCCLEIHHQSVPADTSKPVAYGGKRKELASADDTELQSNNEADRANVPAREAEIPGNAEASRKRRRLQ